MMASDPGAMFSAYLTVFETLDPAAIAAFYDEPALVVTAHASVALLDHATAQQLIAASTRHLRERGYRSTELADLEIRMLAPTLAQCTGVFIRRGEHAELGRGGFTYTLRFTDEWKIAVAIVHDAQARDGDAPAASTLLGR